MENTNLELLLKENSELKEQMELLKSKIRIESIIDEINDLIDEDYSTEVDWDCPLVFYVSFIEKNEHTLYFEVGSSNDYINFHNDTIEISYDDIIDSLEDKPINETTISETIDELIKKTITEW